jgi:leucyl/phenylalanyl-tRNA--protein transferase
VCPEERGQLSIEGLHISGSLKKTILKNTKRNGPYSVKIDTAFTAVMRECAAMSENRPETWINEPIIEAYRKLHMRGFAHSVECWEDGALVGGLYGVAIGGAFFGESMFSLKANTSKIALAHLCARLWKGGYTVLDTQFVNDHLKQFGVYEIPHKAYLERLRPALKLKADFKLDGLSEAELMLDYLQNRDG